MFNQNYCIMKILENQISSMVNGKSFIMGLDLINGIGHFCVVYTNSDLELEGYWPCEEDEEVLRPIYEDALRNQLTAEEACEEVARIMREWDYDVW